MSDGADVKCICVQGDVFSIGGKTVQAHLIVGTVCENNQLRVRSRGDGGAVRKIDVSGGSGTVKWLKAGGGINHVQRGNSN